MMPQQIDSFRVVDSHTGGEPTRLIVAGGPDLGRGSMLERRERMREHFDPYRRTLCNEPRGSDVMVGGILCEAGDPSAACGVIFFNNVGYLGMCGHGTIGVVETLRFLGRITAGSHRIETPVGTVTATLHTDGRASVENVPSRRSQKRVSIDVPGYGAVVGDVAWGGNWFFLVWQHGMTLTLADVRELTAFTSAIMAALAVQGIRGDDGGVIDHVELFGPPSDPARADSRNFVLCPGGAYDRSPCGTGTSAKLACLAADGALGPGELYRQESIVGSIFEASYARRDGQLVPTITGRAHVIADVNVLIDREDAFAFGIEA